MPVLGKDRDRVLVTEVPGTPDAPYGLLDVIEVVELGPTVATDVVDQGAIALPDLLDQPLS